MEFHARVEITRASTGLGIRGLFSSRPSLKKQTSVKRSSDSRVGLLLWSMAYHEEGCFNPSAARLGNIVRTRSENSLVIEGRARDTKSSRLRLASNVSPDVGQQAPRTRVCAK